MAGLEADLGVQEEVTAQEAAAEVKDEANGVMAETPTEPEQSVSNNKRKYDEEGDEEADAQLKKRVNSSSEVAPPAEEVRICGSFALLGGSGGQICKPARVAGLPRMLHLQFAGPILYIVLLFTNLQADQMLGNSTTPGFAVGVQ